MGKAKESKFIKRLRRKIQLELRQNEKAITKAKIDAMRALIHNQLKKTTKAHIDLGARTITSFDENTHSAPIQSVTILRLQKIISEQSKKSGTDEENIKKDSSHQ